MSLSPRGGSRNHFGPQKALKTVRLPRGLREVHRSCKVKAFLDLVALRQEQEQEEGRVKVLVTGASGFTGSHLARFLVQAGHAVRVLVRSSSHRDLLDGLDVEYVEGDLADGESLRRAVSGTECVYHLAAVYREAKLPDRVYFDINVEGTRRLAEAALAEGSVPFIYCSTCGVHGEVADPPVDEMAPYNPGDIYQETKVEAEKLLLKMHREQDLKAVILRPVGIYGRRRPALPQALSRRGTPPLSNDWKGRRLLPSHSCARHRVRLRSRGRGPRRPEGTFSSWPGPGTPPSRN